MKIIQYIIDHQEDIKITDNDDTSKALLNLGKIKINWLNLIYDEKLRRFDKNCWFDEVFARNVVEHSIQEHKYFLLYVYMHNTLIENIKKETNLSSFFPHFNIEKFITKSNVFDWQLLFVKIYLSGDEEPYSI